MSEGHATATVDRDQFITLHGVSWSDYEAFLEIVGESSAPA